MTEPGPSRQAAAGDRAAGEPRLAFGVQEVADALGVSRELVKHMIRTGQPDRDHCKQVLAPYKRGIIRPGEQNYLRMLSWPSYRPPVSCR